MDAAVRTHQQQQQDGEDSSHGSMESLYSEKGTQKQDTSEGAKKKKMRPKSSSQRERAKAVQERVSQYRDGKLNLPAHDVVQNSIHFKTGKVDLQLCDDTMSSGGVTDTVQGSMLIQVGCRPDQGCSI